MRGYKGFDKDLKCRGFQYEIGEEYEHKGDIKLCKEGFHFCKSIIDVKDYYDITDENYRLCEIEASGEVIEGDNKCVTNKIKIIREISKEEIYILGNEGKNNIGLGNTGDRNIGDRNTGDRNTGYWNIGDSNTGDSNTGDSNTGDRNIGDRNTGDSNTGNRNTGDSNTGNRNTGYWNTGYSNTGDFNLTDRSTGCFCTEKQPLKFFDKKSNMTWEQWRNSKAYWLLKNIRKNVWVNYSKMTEEEKAKYPNAETTDGYLKELDLKEQAEIWWDNLNDYEKEVIRNMPNYDKAKFRKIMKGAKIG